MRAQMARLGQAPPPQDEQVYRALLDQLIGGRLLLAEAKRLGLMPSAQEVGAELAQIKQRNPEAFARQLASQGMTEAAAAAELAPDLAIRKLVASEVTPTVKVSDDAARRFYEGNREQMKRPPQVRVRHILVGVPRGAPAAERQAARDKAAALLVRIRAGEDFGALASEASDDAGSRQQGGLMPWLAPGDTVPAFERAAFALQPGQTSDVVESGFGFHLLRLEERKEPASVGFEEAKPQIIELLRRQQAREMLERRVAALRKQARVEVLF
jgi:peptidyl-prolyl cis-trans isomerase C